MEWDEARLLPSALLISLSGLTAVSVAVVATIDGHALAPAFLVLGLGLLVAGRCLVPHRRWSIRLGVIAARMSVPVWVIAAVALDRPADPSISLFCLGMAGAAWWAMRFLREELLPPEWERSYEVSRAGEEAPVDGWIEELPREAAVRAPLRLGQEQGLAETR